MAGSNPQHRVFCWSTSRCMSTAFMKCLGNIEGALAWLEPFGTADFFGPEGRLPLPGEDPTEPEYTPALLKAKLEGDFSGYDLVFIKDFAFSVTDRFHFLPKGYRHSFLIRDPLKSLMSYHRLLEKMPGESLKDWLPHKGYGYGELAELADYVEKDLGQSLVIVDADDIIHHPAVIVERYCDALGLPFSPEMLTWNPGIPSNWIVAKSHLETNEHLQWMANVLNSRGFQKDLKKSSHCAEEIPRIVQEIVSVAQPFYDKLYARRILPQRN